MNLLRLSMAIWGLAVVASGAAFAADVERNPKIDQNSLQMVLDRIHGHAQKDEWQAAGWADPTIEKWLENAVATLGKAVEKPDYKLPVKFGSVRAVDPKAFGRIGEGGLVVGTHVNVAHAHGYIILADGNADVGFADGCVIVARGVVSVAHCNNSVIVSGCVVDVSHDGNGIRAAGTGSMILCRGWANISHSSNTILLAHEGATVSHARNTIFVGPEPKTSHRDPTCKVVKLPAGFPVEARSAHPLEKKIEVLGAIRPKGLLFRYDGKRYAADLAAPIVDETGKKVEALAGWQVTFVGDESAAISSAEIDVPLRLPAE